MITGNERLHIKGKLIDMPNCMSGVCAWSSGTSLYGLHCLAEPKAHFAVDEVHQQTNAV